MDLSASPSVGTELRTLQAELGTLQAGQAAELGQLERALALAQAERAAAVAEAGQRAAEVARLREEVAELRAELRRGQELSARYRLEAATLRANARLRDRQHHGATAQVAWLRGAGTWHGGGPGVAVAVGRRSLGGGNGGHGVVAMGWWPWGGGNGGGGIETTGGLKPFILFIVASTLIFLHPYLKQS
ncbi:hypothetical protein GRJ2_000006400 [Grus japonensis]|uniref:Uncharacterized protein n=1 Tax=Grus japonensis TaxID=30415 RepID=A0ABC9VRX9_GRUJA